MTTLNTDLMDTFVGKSILDICPLGFGKIGDTEHHCAHFVGHVLKLNSLIVKGATCARMTWNGSKHPTAGALIRVDEIYNMCSRLEEPLVSGCLAYYTVKTNIGKDLRMGSMSKKHVGICLGGFVYHYGNTLDKVAKVNVGDLAAHYGKSTITRYTHLPPQYTVLTLSEIQALKPTEPRKAMKLAKP